MNAVLILGCITLLVFSSPVMARIAPGEGGGCPEGLKLDSQSGRCLPPGESRPPLGAPNDPSSNPTKTSPNTPSAPLGKPEPPKQPNSKELPKQTGDDEAREACAPYPGTMARPLSGGYVCVPVN